MIRVDDPTLESRLNRVEKLLIEAVYTDGAHHKQWYLEEIAQTLKLRLPGGHTEGIPA